VAAGVDLPTIGVTDQGWDSSFAATGSSFAAPLVAGMLAVVAQRYPDATGNQLVQTLIHNTGVEDHALERDETGGYGYGAAWLTHMLAVDPAQYPDENPLMDKKLGQPSAEQVAEAAARGSAMPDFAPDAGTSPTDSFDEYGDDEPAADAPQASGAVSPVLWAVGGIVLGVIVIGAIILIVVLTNSRRRRTSQGGPS
jgi:subtilisin family serine protease